MKNKELAISLRNVGYTYPSTRSFRKSKYIALKDINLDIYKGETLGIEGRNGSGKSTLLKLLAGIYEPTAGQINRFRNNVSLQTLAAGFDVELSGEDNALIGAMLLGHPKIEARAMLPQINEMAELKDKFYEPVKTYSSGMRARLGFATAITMQTDVLLIDEVLGVGDAEFREKAQKIIEHKVRSNLTVILVSHAPALLNSICDRIFSLETSNLVSV